MWKRFIKTRCSVISYYWHKSSLVLSFSASSILQDVFIESGQNPVLVCCEDVFLKKIGIYKKIVI